MSHQLRSSSPYYQLVGMPDAAPRSPSPLKKYASVEDENIKARLAQHRPSNFRRRVVKFWLTEWLSCFFAFGSIAGIVAVLVVFDGQPLPDWPFGITLGALVSLLATIATVAMTAIVSSGIGQAQWIWFTRERSMRDFDLVDEASRGPFGAIQLLFRGRGGFFGLTGAMLTIIILGVNPFAQQVVGNSTKSNNSSTASLGIADTYNTFNQDGGPLTRDVDLSMKAAVSRALLDVDATNKTFSLSPRCTTGDCSWEKYTSLAVCGRCADVSSDLRIDGNGTGTSHASLPNNITLDYVPYSTKIGLIAMTVNTTSNLVANLISSLKFTEYDSPLLDVFTIIPEYGNSQTGEMRGPFASECILQFCVQNYTAKFEQGTFTETVVDEPRYLDSFDGATNLTDGDKTYSVQYDTLSGLFTYLEDMFNTVVHQSNGLSPVSQWPDDVSQSIFYWANRSSDHLPTELFHNLGTSMTLNIRSKSNETSNGIASSRESVVDVNWYWMILPFAILAFVLCYLVAVILASRAKALQPWKTSNLPLLMQGLIDDESRRMVQGAKSLDEFEALSEALKAKSVYGLQDGESGRHRGISVRENPFLGTDTSSL